ncbi:MAG: endo-1,4-beta-xylanase [Bacteroidota bacterium]
MRKICPILLIFLLLLDLRCKSQSWIYPFYHNQERDSLPVEVIEFTEDIETQQAEKHGETFKVLRERADKITNVTFWGVADDKTWLSHYFVERRIDHIQIF